MKEGSMRVAIMSDIHGFDLALRSVLADIDANGPFDRIEFYGNGEAKRLSFASQPHMAWHLVSP